MSYVFEVELPENIFLRLFLFGRLLFHSISLGLGNGIILFLTIIAATLDLLLDVDIDLVSEDDGAKGDAEDNAGELDVGGGVDG